MSTDVEKFTEVGEISIPGKTKYSFMVWWCEGTQNEPLRFDVLFHYLCCYRCPCRFSASYATISDFLTPTGKSFPSPIVRH